MDSTKYVRKMIFYCKFDVVFGDLIVSANNATQLEPIKSGVIYIMSEAVGQS